MTGMRPTTTLGPVTLQRMDNVLIVVDDLDAVIRFFVELGMELEGTGPLEGRWVERVIGLDDVRQDIAMLRTPDGPGHEQFAAPSAWRSTARTCSPRWTRAVAPVRGPRRRWPGHPA